MERVELLEEDGTTEQKRRAEYLNNLDEKIEIYQKGIEKMEERNAESS